nr:MAG TPA: hypothetical protein [Bacteriophage sp.]
MGTIILGLLADCTKFSSPTPPSLCKMSIDTKYSAHAP